MSLFEKILTARGLSGKTGADFLTPDYLKSHDPFLLNGMDLAVRRLVDARKKQDKIVIYGDYDIDGISATALLLDALSSFGFKDVDSYIPNRFTEGYGLTTEAIKDIASKGVNLIITVDCGSNSVAEVKISNEMGVDVIVTDHHTVTGKLPDCVAVINPNRSDSNYPFKNLAGVGVAFKLVQALLMNLTGLEDGQEKWLLDLVALGTVCDVVDLVDENRVFAYWGLKVLSKTRRPGLKALMAVSGVEMLEVNSRSLGFGLGPRMNAAGRLETARHSLELVTETEPLVALQHANYLNDLNKTRRVEQDKIFKAASLEAEKYKDDNVLVLSGQDWNHGIVGIVASKIMEKYQKPTFILQNMGEETKGSGRSFGDFSAIGAVDSSRNLLTKGGGHQYAAGITLLTKNVDKFRDRVNQYYRELKLVNQADFMLPKVDAVAKLEELDVELVGLINQLEPFGNGNPEPVFNSKNLIVDDIKKLGNDGQHVKLKLSDGKSSMNFMAFSASDIYEVNLGDKVDVSYNLVVNEWRGNKAVEGRLEHIRRENS